MASTSSRPLWKFDVFLSFRGEDTRKNFVSHLYKELERKGIKTFKDDQELGKGKSISPELLQAIRESKFAVVVISQNYASSGWCLDELVEIVKCEEIGWLTIFPVFYEVDPSDVKKQKGPFAESFQKHKDNPKVNSKKEKQWKDALRKVATIAGEDSRNWNEDSKLIKKIVGEISDQLISKTSSDFSDLIGVEHHLAKLSPLIDLDSTNDVRMIGIWGMPGVGKTTLARYIYETICQHFQTHCFVEDIKKFYREDGPKRLEEKLLTTTLGGALTLTSSGVGSNVIKARLGHQKVLIVIDDVDDIEQLNVLAKDTSWFGPGSRIVVTTQNKRLLIAYGIEHVYEVECLSWDNAIQLFSLYAFNQKQPLLGFERLSYQATHYARGLPLALKVLGSSFRGRSRKEWESILSRFERSLDKGILDILKISYDGLDKQEKCIFLHIAYVFDGFRVEDVSSILDDDDDDEDVKAKYRIQILAERSLVDIHNGNVKMHGLLQKMGRELVQDGDANCRLLINHEEICDPLTSNKVNKKIEGICLDMSQIKERKLSICDGAFERINNLKFIKIYNNQLYNETKVHLPSSIELSKLRYLHWDAYPLKNLPFRLDCLVVLNMRESRLEKLWEGSPSLGKLIRIDLSYSHNLREIPDLSNAPNLEDLDLSDCASLIKVPSSIKGLNKLTNFIMDGCKKLVQLPSNIDLKSLQVLQLECCKRLKGFPHISQNIRILNVTLKYETELPDSIDKLSYLVELKLYKCKRLKTLPTTVGNLRFLEYMELEGCEMLESFPDTIEELVSLKDFSLKNGPNIRKMPRLPANIEWLLFVGTLIEEVPLWIGSLSKLESILLGDNKRLKNLPASISKLECLYNLSFRGCSILENLPLEIPDDLDHYFPNLHELRLCKNDFQTVPVSIKHLSSLRELYLNYCKNLRSLPEVSRSVKRIHAHGCVSLEAASQAFVDDSSVDILILSGCIQLGPEAQLLAQHFMSRDGGREQEWEAWLPLSKVPKSFKHQAKGSSLTIHLPNPISIFPVNHRFQIVLCFIVAAEAAHYDIGMHHLVCEIDYRDSNGHSFCQKTKVRGAMLYPKTFFEAENMLICKRDVSLPDHPHLRPKFFQELHFSFEVSGTIVKLKECGVHLPFLEDIDLDESCYYDNNASTRETSTSSSNVSVKLNSIPMLSGSNFKEWKKTVFIYLRFMDQDLALRIERPSGSSTQEEKRELEKWDKSNHMSLMIMKKTIPEAFRDTTSNKVSSAKAFLAEIEQRCTKSDKAEASSLLTKLIFMRYTGKGNIREYIMEMSLIASKLKALKLKLSDDLLVHLVLISLPAQFSHFKVSYNCQRESWSLNELISHCVQEEERLSLERTEHTHIAFTAASSSQQSKQKKQDKETTCFFCKKKGHIKKSCSKYAEWRAKKGLFALPETK